MRKIKPKYLAAALFAAFAAMICGCSDSTELPSGEAVTTEETAVTERQTDETEFNGTIEPLPDINELSPADPLEALDIKPSDYFTPGVWTSTYTDNTGNFYIFDEDGLHGQIIPMADADGMDFAYSISGSSMTMFVGEELTPYNAELERTEEGHIIIHMTYLGTQDELEYLSGISADGFKFYPARRLAKMAESFYKSRTGITPAGVEYKLTDDDMVVLDLWVKDENGWRKDVESYTVSMFTAAGWSSISFEEIDLSGEDTGTEGAAAPGADDDIPDIEEPDQY